MSRRFPWWLLTVAGTLLLVVLVPLAVAVYGDGAPGQADSANSADSDGRGLGAVVRWDRHVSQAAERFGADHAGWVDAMRWVTQLGTTWVGVVLLAPLAVVVFRAGRRRLAWFVAVVPLTTPFVVEPVKWLVHRPRPTFGGHAVGYSFPSGHSAHIAAYVLVWGVVVVPAVVRRVGAGAARGAALVGVVGFGVLMALAVGGSRVALGVHYPSDVFAGWAAGTAWVAGMGAVALCIRLSPRSAD